MNYHQKYYKYKTKYLELLQLKKIQKSGSSLSEEKLKEINDVITKFEFTNDNQYDSSNCDKFMKALELDIDNEVELTYTNYIDYITKYLNHIESNDILSKLNIDAKINMFLGCYMLSSKNKDKAKQYIINVQESINAPALTVVKKEQKVETQKVEDTPKLETQKVETAKVETQQSEIDLIKNRLKEIEEEHKNMKKEHKNMKKEHDDLMLKMKNHSHSIITTGMEMK